MNQLRKHLEMVEILWVSLIEICIKALAALPEDSAPALLNFWTYRGGGKTTFLRLAGKALSTSEVDSLGPWNVLGATTENLVTEILQAVNRSTKMKKVVLLDNLDALLRNGDGEVFFEFERRLILPLLERHDTLFITTGQIPITQWREYDVRIRQENHPIPALSREEIDGPADESSLDSREIYGRSLGYPQLISWIIETPKVSDEAWAQRIVDYFLENFSSDVQLLALTASLLPVFDIAVLRDVLSPQEGREDESMYAGYIERIRELIGAGLVKWDMHIGAYRFSNPIVRRLLGRSFRVLDPEKFTDVHRSAAAYYEEESRRASYLHYVFVSALYHLAYQVQSTEDDVAVGARCINWVEKHLSQWMGADWDAVLEAWQDGGGDETVKRELQILLGLDTYDKITRLLKGAKQAMEVIQ
jgi:hypothetical protein